jgi:hypothetical protein
MLYSNMVKRKQPTGDDSDDGGGNKEQPPAKKVAMQPTDWNGLDNDKILGELIDILIKRTDINMNSTANEKLEITRL